MAGGHDPVVASYRRVRDNVAELLLAAELRNGPFSTLGRQPVPTAGVSLVPDPPDLACWIQACRRSTPAAGGHNRAERAARRRRFFKIPTDYLRAGQEIDPRRAAQEGRNIGRLISVHENRRSERVLCAMTGRHATLASHVGSAAAAPSATDGLAEMLGKIELSFKD